MTLLAGPELDTIVAERVFGLKRGPCTGEVEETDGGHICTRCNFCQRWGDWRKEAVHNFEPRPYSTSIVSAWEVVEKVGLFKNCRHLHENALGVEDRGHWTRTGWEWVVEQILEPAGKNTVLGRGETVPLAICRAALSLAEEEKEIEP